MTCHCGTQISNNQSPVYRYCPRCGSPTGHIVRLDGERNVTQGLSVQEGQFCTHTLLSFRNEGLNSITLHATLALPDGKLPSWATLNAVNVQVQPGQTFHLTATFTPSARDEWEEAGRAPLALRLVHNDAPRRDPWDAESCRAEMTFTVPLSFIAPAQLEADEEILIFSERSLERTLTLVNLGGQDLRIDHFGYTPEFEVSGVNSAPAPPYVALGWKLPPDNLLRMKARAHALPREVDATPLTVVADGGARRTAVTLLRRPAPQPVLKPAFLVGVDVKAEETLIALRDCENDVVELLQDARRETQDARRNTQDVRQHLRHLKEFVDETILSKTGGAEVDVRFILTLPVLDNGEQLQQRRDEFLRTAQVQEFLVTENDFWLRPVCAALHFLIGARRESFRVDDGQWLAVCDTSEETLTLLQADLTPEGDLTLNVNVQCPMSNVQSLVDTDRAANRAANVSERSDSPPLHRFAHVFIVGDVTRFEEARQTLLRIFPERIVHDLSPEDVTEAVARGAVCILDTYVGVVAPYRITLRDDAGYPPVDLVQQGMTLPGRPRLRTYVVTPQRGAELEVVADVDGHSLRLCRLRLYCEDNENTEYKLRFDHPRPGFLRIVRMKEEEVVMWEGVMA